MISKEVMPSKSFALCVASGTACLTAQAAIQASLGRDGIASRLSLSDKTSVATSYFMVVGYNDEIP